MKERSVFPTPFIGSSVGVCLVLPFGAYRRTEPLGPFEDVGEVHPAAQLAGQHRLLLGLQR